MYIDLGFLRIFISFSFTVFFAVLCVLSKDISFIFAFLSALFHEAVHLLFLFKFGCKKASMELFPGGIKIKADGFLLMPCKKAVCILLSAPVFNIIAGAAFFVLGSAFLSELLLRISAVNLILGVFNLLPLPFLDGGMALSQFLENKYPENKAGRICEIFAVTALLLMTALFFVLFTKVDLSLSAVIFLVYCFIGCFNDKRGGGIT
ncbi:MAG: site-2 protease family protein [Clostridia bacterium]|nr:site-2 protease family protein [Clostridia bacterium]